MARTLALITLVTLGVASSYAGPLGINPGNILNPDGSVSIGLAPTGVAGNNMSNPEGITGSGWRTTNYTGSTQILNSQTTAAALPVSASPCSSSLVDSHGGAIPFNSPANVSCQGTLFTPAAAPEFYMLGDSTMADKGTSANAWITAGNQQGTITIPVGIFGVGSIATMLNTISGDTTGTGDYGKGAYADIQFRFSNSATGSANDSYETIALVNGVTQRNILGGIGGTASAISSSYTATDLLNSNTYQIVTGNVWTSTVNSGTLQTAPPIGTQMNLDYQLFPVLTQFQNQYLVSITINDHGSGTTNREVLSAVSVYTATPEPASVAILLGGVLFIGLLIRRRRRAAL